MNHTVRVREACIDDVPAILLLMGELARSESPSPFAETDEARLRRHGFGERPRFRFLLAEEAGEAVGFLHYRTRYSVWSGSEFISLDDLFVSACARGRGVGRALMRRLAEAAVELDLAVQWDDDPAGPLHAAGAAFAEEAARWSAGALRTSTPAI